MDATYANPAIGIPGVVGFGAAGGSNEFGITAEEAFVDVEITDDFGQPVIFTMSQNTDPRHGHVGDLRNVVRFN